jgi:glycerol-3-phosphate dehydrogenase (NAD(P)+)
MADAQQTKPASPQLAQAAVLGAGAWGTALAVTLANQRRGASAPPVKLWAHESSTVGAINTQHENKEFLPGLTLPETIVATTALADLADSEIVLMVVPAQFARRVIADIAPLLKPDASLVLCAKGVERDSLKFMSDVASDYIDEAQIAVLSGPSFAADVARGLPTAVTLACTDASRGAYLCEQIGSAGFRPYLSSDVIGAEIGGALKNVLAIACGIVAGKKLGESARAAITARGFVEMQRLGTALGAKPETLGGLSGLGDLILTCSSDTSRNFSLGRALGEGASAAQVLAQRSSVSEGAMSAQAVTALAARHDLELPICAAVDAVLSGALETDAAIHSLMARPFTAEVD